MTSALCALRHVDNHILYTLAQQHICTRGSLSPSDWGSGLGLSDGMKKYKWWVRIIILIDNGLLVNCLKIR